MILTSVSKQGCPPGRRALYRPLRARPDALAISAMPRARARVPGGWASADRTFSRRTTVGYDLVTPPCGVTHGYGALREVSASPTRGAERQEVCSTAERCYEGKADWLLTWSIPELAFRHP